MTVTTSDKVDIYSKNQKTHLVESADGNSRDTDARALAACAWRIDDAKHKLMANPKSKQALFDYGEAIRHNQRLWTIFQVALSDPENPLPLDLKITLLNLSRYVDKTSFRAVAKFDPEHADSLISINRTIASGLTRKPEGEIINQAPVIDRRDIPTSLMTSA